MRNFTLVDVKTLPVNNRCITALNNNRISRSLLNNDATGGNIIDDRVSKGGTRNKDAEKKYKKPLAQDDELFSHPV